MGARKRHRQENMLHYGCSAVTMIVFIGALMGWQQKG
jgi:hypothetical protein